MFGEWCVVVYEYCIVMLVVELGVGEVDEVDFYVWCCLVCCG